MDDKPYQSKAYQSAFSALEPSQEAVAEILAPQIKGRTHRTARLGTVLVAAAVAVALLTVGVFAAVCFDWFRVGGAETLAQTAQTDPDKRSESRDPAPQNLLVFEGVKADTYAGFLLPESYQAEMDKTNTWMLKDYLSYRSLTSAATLDRQTLDAAYLRYYRNPDPRDPDAPLLTVEILDPSRTDYHAYFTRYAAGVVKEDRLSGLETIWVEISGSADGRKQYCLFQRNDELGCIAAISSTVSFADAEQAAADLTYVDSGAPVSTEPEQVAYGFRLGWVPEDMTLDSGAPLSEKWWLRNATLADPSQNLDELVDGAHFYTPETGGDQLSIQLRSGEEGFFRYGGEDGTVYQTGTLHGQQARWIKTAWGEVVIEIWFPESKVLLLAFIDAEEPESRIEDAERILDSLELVPIPIAEPAPMEYSPFAVG